MKINLGCGDKLKDGWINYDITPIDGAKKLDLENDTFPHEDNSVDAIECIDVLEHLGKGFFHCLNECHRVLKIGGIMYFEVPKFPHNDSVKDPTHVRFFVRETIDYLCNYELVPKRYGFLPWNLLKVKEEPNRLYVSVSPRKV